MEINTHENYRENWNIFFRIRCGYNSAMIYSSLLPLNLTIFFAIELRDTTTHHDKLVPTSISVVIALRIFFAVTLWKIIDKASKIIIGLKSKFTQSATIASFIRIYIRRRESEWVREKNVVQIIRVVNWFQIGICSDVTTNLLIFVKREEINELKMKIKKSRWVAFLVAALQIEKLNWKLVYFSRPFKGEISSSLCMENLYIDLVFIVIVFNHRDDCERNDFNLVPARISRFFLINQHHVAVVVLSRHSLHSITRSLIRLSYTRWIDIFCLPYFNGTLWNMKQIIFL